jgi:hypothetical protein
MIYKTSCYAYCGFDCFDGGLSCTGTVGVMLHEARGMT